MKILIRKEKNQQVAKGRQNRIMLILTLALSLVCSAGLIGCSNTGGSGKDKPGQSVDAVPVRVASLKGPTSIGLVDFIDGVEQGTATAQYGLYDFKIYGTADEILPQLVSGDIDIALLPANVASVLYNRTKGCISVININTLGVLYIVSADESLVSLDDLAGRTILMTGKGTTPEYVMDHLLKSKGLTDLVTLEYRSEATELAAIISADPTAVALLPEPYVSVVTNKNPNLAARISLTDEWSQSLDGGQLVTGVTVVRTGFLNDHPEAVEEFITNHAASVEAVNHDPEAAAELVVKYGIIDNATVAAQAIPRCQLVCLTGSAMQKALGPYLDVLYQANPESIGGALPGEDFYF